MGTQLFRTGLVKYVGFGVMAFSEHEMESLRRGFSRLFSPAARRVPCRMAHLIPSIKVDVVEKEIIVKELVKDLLYTYWCNGFWKKLDVLSIIKLLDSSQTSQVPPCFCNLPATRRPVARPKKLVVPFFWTSALSAGREVEI